MSEIAMKWYY